MGRGVGEIRRALHDTDTSGREAALFFFSSFAQLESLMTGAKITCVQSGPLLPHGPTPNGQLRRERDGLARF